MKIKVYTGIVFTLMIFGVFMIASQRPASGIPFLDQNKSIRDWAKNAGVILDKFLGFDTTNSNSVLSPRGSSTKIPEETLKAMYNVFDLQ